MERETNLNIEPKKDATYALLIGPEGDFSESEITQATQHNFKPISFGDKRLRTETAVLYGLSLMTNQIHI